MYLPTELSVTDQPVDMSCLSDPQIEYYRKLAVSLKERYLACGAGRRVFGLSGPPGSGKSVTAAILEHFFATEKDFTFVNLGLDAFHYPNHILETKDLLG